MNQQRKGLFTVHFSTVLFGLSGLFAKWVHLPSIILVLWRVIFSSAFLLLILKLQKTTLRLKKRRDYLLMVLAGIVLSIHWTTFMQSIQTSTVAIGTMTFSTFPLFVTFMEPWLFHEKLKPSNVICAIVMLLGVLLIVPEFHLGNAMTRGVLWGMVCSFTYAILSLMNRNFMKNYTSTQTAFYERFTATILLFPSMLWMQPMITPKDLLILLLLGTVCTAIAHTMYIEGLRYVKVQTAGIISGLESVYSILAAFLFLREIPSVKELFGGMVILGVVFYSTLTSAKSESISLPQVVEK